VRGTPCRKGLTYRSLGGKQRFSLRKRKTQNLTQAEGKVPYGVCSFTQSWACTEGEQVDKYWRDLSTEEGIPPVIRGEKICYSTQTKQIYLQKRGVREKNRKGDTANWGDPRKRKEKTVLRKKNKKRRYLPDLATETSHRDWKEHLKLEERH